MYFVVDVTKNDQKHSWWLYADNRKMVAWAGQTFPSEYNARRAAQDFKTGARVADWDIYLDEGGNPRWRAFRGGKKVAASGEDFDSRSNALRAANNVRDNAGGATGP